MNSQENDQLLKRYLNYCRYEKGLTDKTLKSYRIDITQFSLFLGKTLIYCDKGDMQGYLSSLHGIYKVKSVKRKISFSQI